MAAPGGELPVWLLRFGGALEEQHDLAGAEGWQAEGHGLHASPDRIRARLRPPRYPLVVRVRAPGEGYILLRAASTGSGGPPVLAARKSFIALAGVVPIQEISTRTCSSRDQSRDIWRNRCTSRP